jgi:hypothetical protein
MIALRCALAGLLVLSCGPSQWFFAPASAAELTFTLPISNGRLPENLRLIRVHKDDVVKLRWSADKPMSLHLHGYDIEKQVVPGGVTEMSFTARATGRFSVEPHLEQLPSGGHAHGDVLVTIEVYP